MMMISSRSYRALGLSEENLNLKTQAAVLLESPMFDKASVP